jgi:hypothetical protein
LLLFGVRDGRDRPSRRLTLEIEHAHAVHEDDRAAQPAAERQEGEAEEWLKIAASAKNTVAESSARGS